MKISTLLVSAIVLLASCQKYEKTKTGLVYKITGGGSKEKIKQGQFLKINIEYTLPGLVDKSTQKDTVLNSSYEHIPSYTMVDSTRLGKHNFTEILMDCSVGDKIEFVMSIDTLKKLGMIPEYNRVFAKGRTIHGRAEILKSFANEKDVNADYLKELDIEKQKEIANIEKYLKNKNIKAQKTANGVFVEMTNAGNGTKADSGKNVSVQYVGTLLKTGKVFDSSTAGNPLSFVIGSHSVIQGWDEGLRSFTVGGKGKLYVPAMLAYGQQGNQPVIPPYSDLVFDVTVTNVTDAPPPPAAQPGAAQQMDPAMLKKLQEMQKQQHH